MWPARWRSRLQLVYTLWLRRSTSPYQRHAVTKYVHVVITLNMQRRRLERVRSAIYASGDGRHDNRLLLRLAEIRRPTHTRTKRRGR